MWMEFGTKKWMVSVARRSTHMDYRLSTLAMTARQLQLPCYKKSRINLESMIIRGHFPPLLRQCWNTEVTEAPGSIFWNIQGITRSHLENQNEHQGPKKKPPLVVSHQSCLLTYMILRYRTLWVKLERREDWSNKIRWSDGIPNSGVRRLQVKILRWYVKIIENTSDTRIFTKYSPKLSRTAPAPKATPGIGVHQLSTVRNSHPGILE